jgi:hypothetical protein
MSEKITSPGVGMTIENSYFDIDFLRLEIAIKIQEHTILPMHKESAIRGGMGRVLKKEYCKTNAECDGCPHRVSCVYANTLYSNFEIKPSFVTIGESAGFVLVCMNHEEIFGPGDMVLFSMTLFGKTVIYLKEIVRAIIQYGQSGIGKFDGKYELDKITGSDGQVLYMNHRFTKEEIGKQTIREYVMRRKENNDMFQLIRFVTPCTIKHEGKYLKEFHMQPVINNLCRRIYMLNCFMGNDYSLDYPPEEDMPIVVKQYTVEKEVRRFSNHTNSGMVLRGIEGIVWLYDIQEYILDILLAGEIIHIGKNTRFGFGKLLLL